MPPDVRAELSRLLTRVFADNRATQRFLRPLPKGEKVVTALPDVLGSRDAYSDEAVERLHREGMLDRDFFQALANADAFRAPEVAALWQKVEPGGLAIDLPAAQQADRRWLALRKTFENHLKRLENDALLSEALEDAGAVEDPRDELPVRLVEALVRATPEDFARAIWRLEGSISGVQFLPLFPFTWVPEDGAGRVVPTVDPRQRPPAVTLPGPGVVVLRARARDEDPVERVDARVVPWNWLVRGLLRDRPPFPVEVGLAPEGDPTARRDTMVEEAACALDLPKDRGRWTEALQRKWSTGSWPIVVITAETVDADLFLELARALPLVLFVVLVPFDAPSDARVVDPEPPDADPRLRTTTALQVWREVCDRACPDSTWPFSPAPR